MFEHLLAAGLYGFHSDMVEDWSMSMICVSQEMREDMRSYNCSPAALHSWQEQTLAYYAGASVECVEPEELDEDERLARRRAYLEKEFGSVE